MSGYDVTVYVSRNVTIGNQAAVNRIEKQMSDEQMTERDVLAAKMEAEAIDTNKARTGKGTRVKVSLTRGKSSRPVSYENFDTSQPSTLPKSIAEFAELTASADENQLVAYLIDGYNDAMYSAVSDPIAEFIEDGWSEDVKKSFRTAVRGLASLPGYTLESAVAMVKPGIIAGLAASQAQK